MPRMCRMVVAITECFQPVLFSKEVSFLRCRPAGRILRTGSRVPCGQPGRVFRPVNSAAP
jgi:hypothetical protein